MQGIMPKIAIMEIEQSKWRERSGAGSSNHRLADLSDLFSNILEIGVDVSY